MKKWLFKSQDTIAFLMGVWLGFWVNLISWKLVEWTLLSWIIATLSGVIFFIGYKLWIGKQDEFDFYIRHSTWEKNVFDGEEVWICKDTDEYQLVRGTNVFRKNDDTWTEQFSSSKNNVEHKLLLKRNGMTVREFNWIRCDGDTIWMPIPKKYTNWCFYFEKDSLEYRMIWKVGSPWESSFEDIFRNGNIQIK